MVAFHTRNADRLQRWDMSTMLSMGFYPIWIMPMLSTVDCKPQLMTMAAEPWKGTDGLYECSKTRGLMWLALSFDGPRTCSLLDTEVMRTFSYLHADDEFTFFHWVVQFSVPGC